MLPIPANPATAADSMLPIPATNTSSAIAASKRRAELAVAELMVGQKKLKNEGEGSIIPAASSHEVSSIVTSASGGQSRRSVEIEEPLLKLCLVNAMCWVAAVVATFFVICYGWARSDSDVDTSIIIGLPVSVSFSGLGILNYCYGAFACSGSESDKLKASYRLHDSIFLWIVVFYLTPLPHVARRLMHLLRQEKQRRQQEERERQQHEEREKREKRQQQQQPQQHHPIPIHNIPTTHSHAISIYSDY